MYSPDTMKIYDKQSLFSLVNMWNLIIIIIIFIGNIILSLSIILIITILPSHHVEPDYH